MGLRRVKEGSARAKASAAGTITPGASRHRAEVPHTPFSDLLRDLDRGAVSEVVVNGDALTYRLASGQTYQTVAPANYVTANPAFVPDLARKNVRIDVRSASRYGQNDFGRNSLRSSLPWRLL